MITASVVFFAVWLAVWLIARALRWKPKPVAPSVMRPSVRRQIKANLPHVLYHYPHRFRPGRRYIGISNEPAARHRRHLADPRSQDWLPTSTGAMVIDGRFPNRKEAQLAERAAIADAVRRGEDIANTQGVPRWYREARAARARQGA